MKTKHIVLIAAISLIGVGAAFPAFSKCSKGGSTPRPKPSPSPTSTPTPTPTPTLPPTF